MCRMTSEQFQDSGLTRISGLTAHIVAPLLLALQDAQVVDSHYCSEVYRILHGVHVIGLQDMSQHSCNKYTFHYRAHRY